MIDILNAWALEHNIPQSAVDELRDLLTWVTLPANIGVHGDMLEAGVQQRVRFDSAKQGMVLWRNNVGEREDANGNDVRYGLCNDSAQLNAKFKSADLIGIKPVVITADMVGSTIGQFVARECKRANWKYTGTPREKAQRAFLQLVTSKGGDARFTTGD